jgi:hypothetical protein
MMIVAKVPNAVLVAWARRYPEICGQTGLELC